MPSGYVAAMPPQTQSLSDSLGLSLCLVNMRQLKNRLLDALGMFALAWKFTNKNGLSCSQPLGQPPSVWLRVILFL